jgi:hypothetical protein
MQEFKDDEGRPWRLALTVLAALRVREMVTVTVDELNAEGMPTGKKLTKAFDIVDIASIAQTLQVLRSQYATTGEVLYAILVAQVEDRKLTKEQFLDGLRGDCLDAATKSLEEELISFFPQRLRRMVATLARKMQEITGELLDQAEANLATMVTTVKSGEQSGKLPASSECTQETGHSDSSSPPARRGWSTTGGTRPTSSACTTTITVEEASPHENLMTSTPS